MSGIEIAGLVLGVLPVMIAALKSFRAGQNSAASLSQWRGSLDTLIHRLQNARCVFSLKLETLLLAAGIWIKGSSLQNEHNCIRILQKKRVARKLEKYLRSSFDNFLLVVGRYESCLKLIAAKLVNIKRLPNTANDDLESIVTANLGPDGVYQFGSSVRFTLGRKDLGDLIGTLEEQTMMIEKLVDGVIQVHKQKKWHVRLLSVFHRRPEA